MDGRTGYITISVDDGHETDLRTADLLDEVGLRATFYIPATNPERPVMPNESIRRIAARFEVGGHSFHHLPLTGFGAEASRREIVDGKAWLEDIAGEPVRSFCYPQGKFNAALARQVEAAGFACGRTCFLNLTSAPTDPYRWGVSTQAFSHSRAIQVRHAAVEHNWTGLVNYARIFRGAVDWEDHFVRAVTHVASQGGIAHLFLHSWEIDELDAWDKLRRVLERARNDYSLVAVTNGELFDQAEAR
jgi:peptidoglycan/xylan/chitin deacetylase (PgdA/CDA1 family)